MSSQITWLTPALHEYLIKMSLREHPILQALRAETMALPGGQMMISAEQGQLLALLVRIINAKNIINIGTFTGYSALSMALALSAEGRLITCDIDNKTTAIAQHYFKKAGVSEKIEICLAPALIT